MRKRMNFNVSVGDVDCIGVTTTYHQFMFSRNGRNTYDGFSRNDQERWKRCWEFWDMYDCDGGGVYRG